MQEELMQDDSMDEGLKQYLHVRVTDKTLVGDFLKIANASDYGRLVTDTNHEAGVQRFDACVYSGECTGFISDQAGAYNGPSILLNPQYARRFVTDKCCYDCEYFQKFQKEQAQS
jgi:hypothetical protein